MKKFFIRILSFCLPLLLVFMVSSLLLKKIVNSRIDYSLPKNCNSIILGHSQPESALNDSLILNTKNLCNGGEAYLYTYKKLQIVLEHNPQIKKVYLSFSNNQIEKRMDDWTYDNTHLENYFSKYNFKMSSPDYTKAFKNNFKGTINAEVKGIISNAKSIVKNKKAFENNNFGGYLYLKRFKTDSLINSKFIKKFKKHQTDSISYYNLFYLKEIVKLCNQENIKLFFFRTPIHSVMFSSLNEKHFQSIRKQYFSEIPFLDFHNFLLSNDEFGDFDHLNYKGAKKFSMYFNKEIIDN